MCTRVMEFVRGLSTSKGTGDLDEAAVKQGVVLPLLQHLGWHPFDVLEVVPEYSIGADRVDYALIINGESKVFVEVKRAQEDLQVHQEQLLRYAFHQGVPLAVLTNGTTSWFYLPLREGNWEDRKFFSIDVLEQDPAPVAERFVEFLSKARVADGEAVKSAQQAYDSKKRSVVIDRTLPKAWDKLISDPDDLLIDLIAESTEGICGYKPQEDKVRRFLKERGPGIRLPDDGDAQTRRPYPGGRHPPPPGKKGGRVGKFTFKTPQRFRLWGRWHNVTTWKAVLIGCCELVAKKERRRFETVTSLRGTRRVYFSRNPDELVQPAQIPDTDIFAMTNLSADSIVKTCHDVLKHFGYSPGDLEIDAR